MTPFVILAIVLSLAVLLAVLWPLWREARGLVIAGVATLGIATFALYRVVGTPAALEPQATTAGMPATLDEAVAQLEAELKKQPNEPEGWRLLGKSYAALQRYGDAQKAFERAVQLLPTDADLLVEAAQARLFANPERKLDAEAIALLDKAIAINPDHQRALWFVGLAQRQEGKHADAAKTWEPLLAKVDPNTAATLRTQINEARAEAGLPPLAETAPTPAPAADAAPALLTVTVDLAPALKSKLAPDDTLFVFARQMGGPPMPVAAKRLPVSAFPVTVPLSDGDSPMPTLKLSQLPQVQLVARVAKGSGPAAQSGDLEADAVTADVNAGKTYTLTIDRVVP
ncbi:tetratricopeptide repeat protein [Pseudoxanthomonas sp. PXM01]|uniref:tetratricopeptide repeat protein n=1 Tax=Pseudoxanthomonas sp. PXM01 TaxID=2769295 RepID=UPI001780AF03|nr:tetratricopeptide repeat protein [Pseudoxanthomonas sp. PXM01]MBD9469273.1 tetratricopeptide repeat protein [Pseudoxanthomonas sp. PXM01]